MSNRLTIGPEGFVDLRRSPPPDTDRVNGWSPENGQPAPVMEPVTVPPKPVEDVLPGRQKGTDGLERPEPPVLVPVESKPKGLMRINSVSGPECYALVTPTQFEKLGKFEWQGTRSGKMWRRDDKGVVRWLHREAARVFRSDRFVVFRNNDERLLIPSNLLVVASKEKMHEMKHNARLNAAGR